MVTMGVSFVGVMTFKKAELKVHEGNMNIFYSLLNLGLSTVHIIFGKFLLNKFLLKQVKFPLLI